MAGMNGINASTGQPISGTDHIRQSVRDILTTPIGSRVARRAYGSRVPELVDSPISPSNTLDIIAAAATALALWETRVSFKSIKVSSVGEGSVVFDLAGTLLAGGLEITMEGIEVS